MYRIVCSDGTVLYDQSEMNGDRVVTEPTCTPDIGQNGSTLQFSMLPSHPAYDSIETMKTYISAEEDGDEIFYGRVTEVRVEKTTGVKQVACTGAMTFLDDFELPPLNNDEQDMTAADFFRHCIEGYGTELGNDSKRALSVGIINHSKSSTRREFGLTSYQKVKQALDTFIIKEFGGYIRIRRDNGVHVVDWIENYGTSNESPIELANNVITHENAITSNEFFTVIHPLGKDGASLPEITINVDDDLVNEYGRIVKTVSFNNASTVEDLRSEVAEYKTKMAKGLGKTCTVKLIDVHFLDSSVDRLQLGAVYENIAGFENEGMTVFSMELHFDNPAEDTITLKNHRELSAVKNGSSTGKISKILSTTFANIHKHITETKDMLSIHADIIELHGKSIRETATEFERYSRDTDSTIGEILGTGVLQNSDHITQVAGNFTSKYAGVTNSRINKLIAKGISPKSAGLYEIESITITEDMIGSGIELFGSPNDALNGRALDTSSLNVGDIVYRAVLSDDSAVQSGKHYYSKSLMVGTGTEVLISEDGQEVNVYESIDSVKEDLITITGSALWTQREGITGVAGQFEVQTDPETQQRTLVIVSGGGMKIRRDNVEYGLYDDYNLTGGIIVNKINNGGTQTKITGDHVVVGSGQTQTVLTTAIESIDNVVGEFDVIEDPNTGTKTLVVASGGGMKIRRNNVEYGIYDDNNLTGGIIVNKINDVGTLTQISGNRITVGSGQTQRVLTTAIESIDNVVGEFEVEEDPATGVKTLILSSGGGMKIRENTQEFGIFHGGNLTGGIIVDKINGQGGSGTLTQIRGEFVDITASQVRVGDTSDVAAWMSSTGQDISDLRGLVADRATIAQLYAQKARIDSLETDALTAENIESSYLASASISVHALTTNNISANSITLTAGVSAGGNITGGDITGNALYGDSLSVSGSVTANGYDISNPIVSGTVGGEDNDTLTLYRADGTKAVTFKKAASITAHLVGSWSGRTYTVEADNDPNVIPVSVELSASTGTGAGLYDTYTINTFSSDHKAYGRITTPGVQGPLFGFAVDATSEYEAGEETGWNDGYDVALGYVTMPGAGTGASFTVGIPNSERTGSENRTFTITKGTPSASGGYAAVQYNNQAVCRISLNDWWTGGVNSVTVSAGGWENGANRVSASNGKYVDVTLPAFTTSQDSSFTSHKKNVYFTTASVTGPVKTVEVDATSEYNAGTTAGYNSAKLSGSWSDNQFLVTKGNSGTNQVGITVTATISYSTTTHKYTAKANGDGTTVHSVESGTQAYDAGWTGSYNAVTLSATGTKTLGYGESVTVYPKAKSTSSATAANITSISYKITAPSDRYQTGYNAGKTDGIASVTITKVEQQGEITYKSGNFSVPVKATASNSQTGAGTISVDGSPAYNAGWTGSYKAVTLSATGTKTLGYGESVTVYPKAKSTSSATAANITSISYKITAPSDRYQTGYNAGKTDGIASVTITKVEQQGEITYTNGNYSVPAKATASNSATGSGTITFAGTAAYNAGWTGCYGTVGLDSTTAKTLGYGESVTVYAQAKSSSGATSKTNVASRKITAPSDRYQTGYNAGKTDGIASVTITKVEQQGEITYTNGNYSVPAKATASNSATGSGTITFAGTAAYNAGWTGCYGTVGLDSTTAKTLDYGESVTVYAQAKSSSGATSKTNVASRKITAPSDRYQTGYNAGKTDGIASVTITKVEQQGEITYSSGNYSVPAKATASNSATGSGTITFSGSAAYNAGWNAYRSALLSAMDNKTSLCYKWTYRGNLYSMPQQGASYYRECYNGLVWAAIPDAK